MKCDAHLLDGDVVCYEHRESKVRKLKFNERRHKPECKECLQLTAVINKMLKSKRKEVV